jgi:hypothetical protein
MYSCRCAVHEDTVAVPVVVVAVMVVVISDDGRDSIRDELS